MLSRESEVHVVQTPSEFTLTVDGEIQSKYADVFQGLGELGEPLHLKVDELIKAVHIPPRGILEVLRIPSKIV